MWKLTSTNSQKTFSIFFSKKKCFTFRFSKNRATVVAGDRAGPDAELGRTGLRNGAVTCRQDRHMQRRGSRHMQRRQMFRIPSMLATSGILPFWTHSGSELVSWHLCSFGSDLLATTCALTSMHHATGQNLVSHLDINIIKTGLCMSASNSPVTCPTTCCWTSRALKVSFGNLEGFISGISFSHSASRLLLQVPPLPCPNAQQPPCRLARCRFGMANFKNLGWLATFRVFGSFEWQKFNQKIQSNIQRVQMVDRLVVRCWPRLAVHPASVLRCV